MQNAKGEAKEPEDAVSAAKVDCLHVASPDCAKESDLIPERTGIHFIM